MKISFKQSTSFFLLFIILVFTFFINLSFIPVRIWDEARNANNAFAMYQHGNWMIPYYEGQPDMWNTKPPLLIWLQTINMHLFGVNEFALRLPAALSAIATGLLLWWFCKKYFQYKSPGFLAGCVFASTFAYVLNHAGRTGDYDALMVLFMTSYCFSFFNYTQSNGSKWLYAFWILVTLATFTKGIAGLTLLPGVFLFAITQKKVLQILKSKQFYFGIVSFILVIGGYYFLREQYNPGYLKAVYQNELGGRYLTSLEGHQHPFGYYYDNLRKLRYSYWFYFILPAFIFGFLSSSTTIIKITLFNLLMVVPFFLIISTASTKLEWYELPVYPFLALQIGIFLFTIWQWIEKYLQQVFLKLIFALTLFVAIFFTPYKEVMNQVFNFQEKPWDVEPHEQSYFLQNSIRQNNNLDNYVFCYSDYNGQINFYIQKLQAQNVNVKLNVDVENILPGQFVVVSQQEMEQRLLYLYTVKKLDEKFGCSVYLVQRRL